MTKTKTKKYKGFKDFYVKNRSQIPLTAMSLPAVILVFMFSYMPMFGIILAFKDFNVREGIFGSPWCGFANFSYLFKSNDAFIMLRRRTEENINRWAGRYGIMTTAKDTYKNAKDKRMGRYVAVNLENCNTIEFRIFRGTLNYKTFIATLQLIDEICFHAIHLSDKEMESMSWSSFVSMILPKKAELIEYLKAKRLFVNEPTEDEEVM